MRTGQIAALAMGISVTLTALPEDEDGSILAFEQVKRIEIWAPHENLWMTVD
jgi:hypothetical protein